jgi:hypothetical protein
MMAKTKFRLVYEGSVDVGGLDPAGVAQAFMLAESGDIGYELSVWESIDPMTLKTVEVVEDDS